MKRCAISFSFKNSRCRDRYYFCRLMGFINTCWFNRPFENISVKLNFILCLIKIVKGSKSVDIFNFLSSEQERKLSNLLDFFLQNNKSVYKKLSFAMQMPTRLKVEKLIYNKYLFLKKNIELLYLLDFLLMFFYSTVLAHMTKRLDTKSSSTSSYVFLKAFPQNLMQL